MPVTTVHQFINDHLVQLNHTRLLLGSIHPHNVDNFRFPYFYGNVGSLWDRLSEAFPDQVFNNLVSIIQTMADNNVWVSDIIQHCDREHAGITRDQNLYNLVLNTDKIREGLRYAPIDTIYFTSAFVAQKFGQAFNLPIQLNPITREITIPNGLFNRPITGIVLYSPSRAANVGIAGSPNYHNWVTNRVGQPVGVNLFRVEHYQEKMPFFLN